MSSTRFLRICGAAAALIGLLGCAPVDQPRDYVRRALRDLLNGYPCRSAVCATVLAQTADTVITVTPSADATVELRIRQASDSDARCDVLRWTGTQQSEPKRLYEVPNAATSLNAVYARVCHPTSDRHAPPEHVRRAHITTGTHWSYTPCGPADLVRVAEVASIWWGDVAKDDPLRRTRYTNAEKLQRLLSERNTFSRAAAMDLLLTLFDRAAMYPQLQDEP